MENYDFVVVGAGPAGRRGAIQAAKAGKSVLLIDKGYKVGGVCLHTGTVPSKTLRETVLNLSGYRERGFYGRSYTVKSDITFQDLKERLGLTVKQEVEVLEDQLKRNDVNILNGTAKFLSKTQLQVTLPDGEVQFIGFKKILLAVGTKPFRPDYIPFDGDRILDSAEILDLKRLPKSLTVIGAGVIGLEYATIFSALGIPITIIEPRKKILDFLDSQIVKEFEIDLHDRGIEISLDSKAVTIKNDGNNCFVKLENGRAIKSDMVLFAAGRIGNTQNLGLENCGLDVDHRSRIKVNGRNFETEVSGIYAAGDVIGFPSLASTSMEQGRIAACHALNIPMSQPPDYFPYGIYSVPEISSIGLTEEQLKSKSIQYECGIARLRETSRGQIMGINSGVLKLIFELKSRQLLGVHILGEGATELIHIGQAVLNLNGKLEYFIDNIFNYPTLAEAYKVAALDAWNKIRNVENEENSTPLEKFDTSALNPLNKLKEALVSL